MLREGIQQWHSRALNMRKLSMWTCCFLLLFCLKGGGGIEFVNGLKIRRRCEVGFRRVNILTVLCRVKRKA